MSLQGIYLLLHRDLLCGVDDELQLLIADLEAVELKDVKYIIA